MHNQHTKVRLMNPRMQVPPSCGGEVISEQKPTRSYIRNGSSVVSQS